MEEEKEEEEEEEAKHLRHRPRPLLLLLLLLLVVLLGLPWEVVREAGAADPNRRCRCRCWAGFAERRCEGCRIGGAQTPPPDFGGESWRRRSGSPWRTELVPLQVTGCEERQTTR